jgi:hypothetical protein
MRVLIVLVIAWCVLVAAAMVAAGTRRFEAWDIYLAGAAVIIGLAIVIAIRYCRDAQTGTPPCRHGGVTATKFPRHSVGRPI